MEDYRAQLERGVGYVSKRTDDAGPTRVDLIAAKDKRIAELEERIGIMEDECLECPDVDEFRRENARLREELLKHYQYLHQDFVSIRDGGRIEWLENHIKELEGEA